MQIIFLCLALIIYISLVFAVKFPIDSEGKSLAPLIRSGGFSLAAVLVLLLISRLMIDWSAALEELFQILYGFLLLICLFWLFFSLFLTVKYGWICRKKQFICISSTGRTPRAAADSRCEPSQKPFDFSGPPSSGLCGNSSRAAGSWRSRVGERTGTVPPTSIDCCNLWERAKHSEKGVLRSFPARRHHDEAPRSYRLGETN